jgi:hypothetical protein
MVNTMSNEQITMTFEWKKVSENGKFRWRQVVTRERFMKDVDAFRDHVFRVKTQYTEMKRLRENLPEEHAMAWMDFAENFTCSALEEVQSAYWNADMVTLHTSVIYFLSSHTKTHVSVVGVSETLSYNANTVHAMIKKLVSIVKEEFPQDFSNT